MKYCKQCGAQMKDEAVFCPSCGTKTQETDNIGVWRNLDEQKEGKHVHPITDNGVVQNLMNKIPDNAKDQMKELSGKAKEGVSQLAEKAREYGGKLTEKAEDFTQNVSQTVRDIPRPDISGRNENTDTVRTPHKANRKLILSVLVILVLVIGIGGIYYLSRVTLVGVWKVVDTEEVDLTDIDLMDPQDILEKTLLTLGSGTRIVFTKEGDLFATASLGGVTIGPGTMGYSKNGNGQFTIHASIDAVLTTLNANYNCSYEFDGPDRLLIHIGEATLVLTRDRSGDPEEYLNQIQESGIGINLNLGGDEEGNGGITIPQSGEELKEDLQDIGNGISNIFDIDF